MNNRIQENAQDSEALEKLYRSDRAGFSRAFYDLYPENADKEIFQFWKARLDFEKTKERTENIRLPEVLILIGVCLLCGFLIKLPQVLGMDEKYIEEFYYKNIGLIVFGGLSVYVLISKQILSMKRAMITAAVFTISAVYINVLPTAAGNDSMTLVCIHLPLMIWSFYGLIWIGFDVKDKGKRIDFLRYNGDLLVLSGLILIAGMVLSGLTFGLFEAIDVNIEKFYMDYVAILGAVSIPIVATHIALKFPNVANKIAPVIANLFCPLVMLMLMAYLSSLFFTEKNLLTDRNMLAVFNLMLLGVMAIVIFSISEFSIYKKRRFNEVILFLLAAVAFIVDLMALSAIVYRLVEYGFTPNRTAVLGSNVLILGNLFLIVVDLFRVNFKKAGIDRVERTTAGYLPLYVLWTIFVVIGFPLIFGFN